MAKAGGARATGRPRLSRETVLAAAVELADRRGIGALTMRTLARALGVEAMSLYHHVAGKEEILDGMVDRVFAEIGPPPAGGAWRDALRARARAVRATLVAHPWAVGLMDSRRSPGPTTLAHHDAVIGCLRAGGFSIHQAAHAYPLLDSYVYGFVLQQINMPFEAPDEAAALGAEILAQHAAAYPHLTELLVEHVAQPGYDFADEFDRGLELVLDAIGRLPDDP